MAALGKIFESIFFLHLPTKMWLVDLGSSLKNHWLLVIGDRASVNEKTVYCYITKKILNWNLSYFCMLSIAL